MPATGNITEDAHAIRELVQDGSRVGAQSRLWPWPEPETETAFDAARAVFGAIPSEIAELYAVTSGFAAGDLTFVSLEDSVAAKPNLDHLARYCGESAGSDFWPNGDLLWLSGGVDDSVVVQVGGEDSGRVWELQWQDEFEWRTLAWSLSDVVACVRDLYEAGWFTWYANPMLRYEDPVDPETLVDSLMPIVDQWNCNPRVAGFVSPYARDPERPTNR